MQGSVWRFTGDPDELERGYLRLAERIPASRHVLHAAARTPDGLLIFDTCPSEGAFHAFFGSADVQALFAEVGLVDGVAEDYPVVRAYAQRAEVDSTAWDEP